MPSVTTSITINKPPAEVRAAFLKFEDLPKYSPNGSITQIKPLGELVPGQHVEVKLGSYAFKGLINDNTAEEFAWTGSIPGLFTGRHYFKFSPGEAPGTTQFHQGEDFSGLLGFMMLPSLGGASSTRNFQKLNEDLKAWCEKQ